MRRILPNGMPGERLERGVYVMPATGDEFEAVLFAVRADGRMLRGVNGLFSTASRSDSLMRIADDLAAELDTADPMKPRQPRLAEYASARSAGSGLHSPSLTVVR